MSITAPPPTLAEAFALILGALRRAAAARMARHPLDFPVLMLLWVRLGRTMVRFAALAERAEAGRLPPSRAASPRKGARPRPERNLPRGFGWLCRRLPMEAACFGSQLQHLLTQPEMQTLIAAAPRVGRILRPLCHMMAVPRPAILDLPARPPSAPPLAAAAPEPAIPVRPPEPPQAPSRGTPAWARGDTPGPGSGRKPG